MDQPRSVRRERFSKFLISTFDFWLLLSAFFTTVGSIVILYAPSRSGICNRNVEIAAVTLQGIGVLFALMSMVTAAWSNTRSKTSTDMSNSKPPTIQFRLWRRFKPELSTRRLSSRRPIIQACIIIIINIVTLIMAVIILVTGDCENFVYNAVYNIFGVVGSFLINIIQAIEIQRHVNGSAFYYDVDTEPRGTEKQRNIIDDFIQKVQQLNNRSLPSQISGKNPEMNSSDEQIRAEVVHETR